MQDRLGDLKGSNPFEESVIDIKKDPNIENEPPKPKFMEAFFANVETAKSSIGEISLAIDKIFEVNAQATTAASAHEEQDLAAQLKQIVDETNRKSAITKGILQAMKEETEMKAKDPSTQKSELRIRHNMHTTLTKTFMDVMKNYQKCQQKCKKDIKNKVKRQVQIVKPDATDEEVDMVMRSADPGSIYKSAILMGSAESIKASFANCQDKYQDVLHLERSVTELHQMFIDLALLVEQQGEMLDQIEFQVKAAADYIDSGNEEISKAIKSQTAARKKKCCLVVFGLVIILILCVGIGAWKG